MTREADDPELGRAIDAAGACVEALHSELLAAHPVLRGTLAVPGILVGHGLGAFVANGLPDDQIVSHVLTIVGEIRKGLGQGVTQDDAASVH